MTNPDWWRYENLPPSIDNTWPPNGRQHRPDDQHDFHLDLGCGKLKKARLGLDCRYSEDVDVLVDLDTLSVTTFDVPDEGQETLRDTTDMYQRYLTDADKIPWGLPFPDESIESIISHHALEHVGYGFMELMNETFRIIKPGGMFRIVVPLYPSHSAVGDPDHKRYFCEGTFRSFEGAPDGSSWLESFSVPYTSARFAMTDLDCSPPPEDARLIGTEADQREMRVTLQKR